MTRFNAELCFFHFLYNFMSGKLFIRLGSLVKFTYLNVLFLYESSMRMIYSCCLLLQTKYHCAWPDSPQVDERWLVAAPPVAQEDLRRHQAAVVEVGRVARGRLLHAGVARGHLLAHRADHHRHVGDGRFGPGRLVAGIVKVDLLLQGPGRLRQSRHHKVVGYTRALVLHHRHLPSPPAACTATQQVGLTSR